MQFVDEILVPISPAPYTKKPRVAKHESFVILNDLNMIQQVVTHYVDEAGVNIHDLIEADPDLSDAQKALAKAEFPTRTDTSSTVDSYCDPATGIVVERDVEGAIPQRTYFQAPTVDQVLAATGLTGKDSFAHVLYSMLAGEILKTDARQEL